MQQHFPSASSLASHDPLSSFREAIFETLGHGPGDIDPGRLQRFPTSAKRGDKAGWCKLFDDLRGGVFGCYRLGVSETWNATDKSTMTRAERAAMAAQVMRASAERNVERRKQWAVNAQRNARLLRESELITRRDAASLYLERRGLGEVWPLPECLRLHRALPYWEDGTLLGTFAAMLAPLTAPDGRIVAVHRTYLDSGRKADVPDPKKLTGASGSLAGACIALRGPSAGTIGIAEGIETALAASCLFGLPAVAAYSGGNLAAWHWPAGVKQLVIFADADKTGREAADKLKTRGLGARLNVDVKTPALEGEDWADVQASRGAETVEAAA